MARMVNCAKLGIEAAGLDEPPYPGELGQRIYDNISQEAWQQWLQHLVMVVNELQLNSSDPKALAAAEKHMIGFLFNEGDLGQAPEGFTPK